jgi:signal transduction histidine kinase/CheY-like chemotaxis protein
VPTARVLQNLKDGLTRSRAAEAALQKHQEELEELVNDRTAQLSEALRRAEEAIRAKTLFFAKMSHELRTPLNAIIGFSHLIGRDPSVSEQHRKDIAIVRRSGENLLALIDDVLNMARIERGDMVVQNVPFDLVSLCNEVIGMLQEAAERKNLHLSLNLNLETSRFARSDAAKLRQVLTNLVGNAIKYTEEGAIVLRAATKRTGPEQLLLIFEVEDTGIGISPEDQRRIFDPFVQAGNHGNARGVGLGLSISRQFVEAMGGKITVQSTAGKGSVFRVEAPARIAEASEVPDSTAELAQVVGLEPDQPDFRVLIVEDQEENRTVLRRLLETAGFQVALAHDGAAAVEMVETWHPHFIWMDLRLPVLSGIDAVRLIRSGSRGNEIRIAAVTASVRDLDSQIHDILAGGFDDVVRKP